MGLKVREAGVFVDVCQGGPPAPTPWIRNAAWPALTAPGAAEQKIVGLYAVWPGDGTGNGGNFFAFNAQGAYNIDFGDGTVTDYASNTQANYEYNFNNSALNGTNCPVTFTDTGDTVNRTAHGLANGAIVRFYDIVTTTGILVQTSYYVVNATADAFQVALTAGGAALPLTGDGSATLLPHKVALVTITPQSAQNLTVVNLNLRHNATALQQYSSGWLDIACALPNVSGTNLTFSSATAINRGVQHVNFVSTGAVTSLTSFFRDCRALRSVSGLPSATAVTSMQDMFRGCFALTDIVPFPGTVAAVNNMSGMFQDCFSLTTIPAFPGTVAAVNNMGNMFFGCRSLTAIPAFSGTVAAVTNMSSMFQDCLSLTTIPAFSGTVAAVNNMSGMLANCSSLTTIPAFPGTVAAVTNMSSMFAGCWALTTIPAFPGTVAAVTNMSSMFANCASLVTIPAFPGTVAAVTNMQSIFQNCRSLASIPPFPGSVAAVTNMRDMFNGCHSLMTIPPFPSSTAAVTNMTAIFQNCTALSSIPPMDTVGVTSGNFNAFVGDCQSIARIQATGQRFTFSVGFCKLSAVALNEIFTGLPTVTGQTITVTGNYGITEGGYDSTIATAKGWSVSP